MKRIIKYNDQMNFFFFKMTRSMTRKIKNKMNRSMTRKIKYYYDKIDVEKNKIK